MGRADSTRTPRAQHHTAGPRLSKGKGTAFVALQGAGDTRAYRAEMQQSGFLLFRLKEHSSVLKSELGTMSSVCVRLSGLFLML